jgi:hypothetical protein
VYEEIVSDTYKGPSRVPASSQVPASPVFCLQTYVTVITLKKMSEFLEIFKNFSHKERKFVKKRGVLKGYSGTRVSGYFSGRVPGKEMSTREDP